MTILMQFNVENCEDADCRMQNARIDASAMRPVSNAFKQMKYGLPLLKLRHIPPAEGPKWRGFSSVLSCLPGN